jgi:glycosyltransferase involved in cell wall biosynthesis
MVFCAATLARQQCRDLRIIWLDSGFNLYRAHFRLVMRWCFPRAARVAAVSRVRVQQLLAEGLDPAKAAVMPLGTDFHLQPLAPSSPHDTLRIGIVGRLVPIKNFEMFLRAAQLVAARHPRVQFVIVGGQGLFPDEIAYYQSLLRLVDELGLRERVIFHEPVEHLAALLNTFDILACTSHLETFGRTLIEAMALSKPVVATAVGAIPEVVKDGETGFLTVPDDAADFAARLNQLIEDAALRARLGRRGHERVLQHFDVRLVARRWEQTYAELLAT